MSSVWQRFRRLIRDLGLPTAFLYLLQRLLGRAGGVFDLHYYRFLTQALQDAPRLSPGRGNPYSFRLLKKLDPALGGFDRSAAVIEARFAQGAECLLVSRGDVPVGWSWFARAAYVEDEVRVDYVLPPDGRQVWDFDVFVAEPERMGFLFARQWDAFDALLQPQGVRYTVSRISAFNRISIASHSRFGAIDCGRALFVRIGPAQLMFASLNPYLAIGGRPRLHFGPPKVLPVRRPAILGQAPAD